MKEWQRTSLGNRISKKQKAKSRVEINPWINPLDGPRAAKQLNDFPSFSLVSSHEPQIPGLKRRGHAYLANLRLRAQSLAVQESVRGIYRRSVPEITLLP